MILPIYAYGENVLRKKASEIEKGLPGLEILIANMFETMYASSGVGLAAPQIGKGLRLFIADGEPIDDNLKGFKKVFINPEILLEAGPEWEYEEGCLSIPTIRENVSRKEKLRIKYYDEKFDLKEEEFTGIAARIIQHEFDHIEGILFIDRISPLKRRFLKRQLTQISQGKVDIDYKMKFPLR